MSVASRDSERGATRFAKSSRGHARSATAPEPTYASQRTARRSVFVTVSCDTAKLAHSADLPASIYDDGEETFGGAEMDALVAQALSMGAQADFAPQLATVAADRPRYNRIEGLSLGARADQVLGAGYSLHASARIGVADREPNAELTGSRSDLRRTLSLTAYNRLVSAGDWGNPLNLGSSISAFLFGRDEGFYYRSSGVELRARPTSAARARQLGAFRRAATPATTHDVLAGAFGESRAVRVRAEHRGRARLYLGARTRYVRTLGLDQQASPVQRCTPRRRPRRFGSYGRRRST